MTTYDVVVIGDGSFNYVKSMVNEILKLEGSGGGKGGDGNRGGNGGKRLFDTFKGAFHIGGAGSGAGSGGYQHNVIHDMF